jgi:mono/diheme cytochrome c family protein
MPFANYTKVTRADSDAIYAYLMSVPPVKQPNRPHELRFPFNQRELLVGWRTLYFKEGDYQPDPAQSKEWNRGGYLVQGLGHCSMCHTAVSALGGSRESEAFSGGMIPNQNWYAPSLTSNREAGLGDWSLAEISDLLQAGVSHRGAVYGPMAEVTFNSLQFLNDEDVRAMAVYLKSLPPQGEKRPEPQAQMVAPGTMESGRKLYATWCGMCHGDEGKGFHRDDLARQPDPHGVERGLCAGHAPESATLRHAAVRAPAERRGGRCRGHVHPGGLGQRRNARHRRPGQCAARGAAGVKMQDHESAEDNAVERIVREGPSGTWAVAGVATFLVVLIYFLFYFLAYLPRGAVQ